MKRYTVAALLSAIAAPSLAQEVSSTVSYSSNGSSHAAVQSMVPVPEAYHHTLTVPGVGDTIASFDPEVYIDSVLGVQPTTANATTNPHAAHQEYIRADLRRQLNLRKQEMMHDYAKEMFELQLELQEIALQLEYCNWNCVNQCSHHAIDIRSKAACVDTCGCYQGDLPQRAPTTQVQQNQYVHPSHMALFSQPVTTTATNGAPVNGATTTPQAIPLTPEQQFQLAEQQLQAKEQAYEHTLEQQEARAELMLEQQIQAEEMKRQQAWQAQELQFEQAMLALDREQAALEQAMISQQQQLQMGVYPTTAPGTTGTTQSIADMVNQQRQQQLALDAKRLQLERQHELATLQAEYEQRQFETAIHEQKLQQEYAFEEQMANLEFQAALQEQNLIEQQQSAYTTNLPPQFQDLLAQQNQAARDEILRDRLHTKVELSMDRVLESKTANHAQFKAVLDSAAKSLGCDPLCVDQCAAFRMTMEEQANCLDICLCYATPQERALLQGSLGYGTTTTTAATTGSTGSTGASATAQASTSTASTGSVEASTAGSTTTTTTTTTVSGSKTVDASATLSLGQTPQVYDTVSTMALFGGILILGMIAFHYMKKEKKTEKEATPFEETAYSLLQA